MNDDIKRQHAGPSLSRLVSFGGMVFIAGTTADNKSADCRAQTAEVLRKIERFMADANTDKSRILWCNVWLANIDEKEEMDAAWQAWIGADSKPARATVESRLATPDTRVEIAMTCAARTS